MEQDRNRAIASEIAVAVAQAGGRAYFVGGLVRDGLLGRENKDIDIEVHGLTPDALGALLDRFGTRDMIGSSFGVFNLHGYDLDIAMPRKEECTGRGHRDFTVLVDPFLGPEKAARRRDFTVNALMQDVLSGEIVDPFHGVEDLNAGILRHVCAETFVEDPLRVLRGAQFAARFDFSPAPETVELCRSVDLSALPQERVFGELEKALLKAEHPSVFFEVLRKMEQLDLWFPELKATIGIPQNPKFHPEGDVWNHTMLVLDEAAKLRKEAAHPLGFMLAAITHDFGKVIATKEVDGRLVAYGHETYGLEIAERFLRRLTRETKLIRYVLNLTEFHMQPNILASQHARQKSMNRLFDRSLDPKGLLLFSRADHLGRTGAEPMPEAEAFQYAALAAYEELMRQPQVMGADLIAAGIKPGPTFSQLLAYARKLHLAGIPKEHALPQTLAYERVLKKKQDS